MRIVDPGVYLLSVGYHGYKKIGRTQNLESRLAKLRCGNPDLRVVLFIPAPYDHPDPIKWSKDHELVLKGMFAEKHRGHEIYDITPAEFIEASEFSQSKDKQEEQQLFPWVKGKDKKRRAA